MVEMDVVREIKELKTQLSYSKNIGFFLGAGASCALGLPNIAQLTQAIENALTGNELALFEKVKADLTERPHASDVSIEDILNQIRRIREITGEQKGSDFIGIDGASARDLDIKICRIIYNILTEKESHASLDVPKKFLAWLSMQNGERAKEIFTTNYDLILERAFEAIRAPYFDGFVGSYEPFFWQESVEQFVRPADVTHNWVRLWKVHGSLSWFWKRGITTGSQKVVRLGKVEKIEEEKDEIVIYPSKDKYDSSRRQPFLVYFDRLRNYLLSGELLFVISGYSFLDQHINEIILNCARQNNRLNVVVFFYADHEIDRIKNLFSGYFNISAFGPTLAMVNGVCGQLTYDEASAAQKGDHGDYWDIGLKKFMLGDFRALVEFVVTNSGRKSEIERSINED